ncbi:MAG: nucleotide exchange factor GrpE [Parcubacteria group bacterium]|nr:nucleotide exchange factor GrpE [Parcubacteria group bacterium]
MQESNDQTKDNTIPESAEPSETESKKFQGLTADQAEMKSTESEAEKCHRERDEYLAGWQRVQADFANFKRQIEMERKDTVQFFNEELLRSMLPVLIHYEKATAYIPFDQLQEPWVVGIIHIKKLFADVLSRNGILQIEVKKGENFDPVKHEAIKKESAEGKSGTILEVLEAGYTLHGKVLSPAKVIIFA